MKYFSEAPYSVINSGDDLRFPLELLGRYMCVHGLDNSTHRI